MFFEHLLCARYYSMCWEAKVNKSIEFILQWQERDHEQMSKLSVDKCCGER